MEGGAVRSSPPWCASLRGVAGFLQRMWCGKMTLAQITRGVKAVMRAGLDTGSIFPTPFGRGSRRIATSSLRVHPRRRIT